MSICIYNCEICKYEFLKDIHQNTNSLVMILWVIFIVFLDLNVCIPILLQWSCVSVNHERTEVIFKGSLTKNMMLDNHSEMSIGFNASYSSVKAITFVLNYETIKSSAFAFIVIFRLFFLIPPIISQQDYRCSLWGRGDWSLWWVMWRE